MSATLIICLTLGLLILIALTGLIKALRGRSDKTSDGEQIADLLRAIFGEGVLGAQALQTLANRLSERSARSGPAVLEEALIDYFSYTKASRLVMKALISSEQPLTFQSILEMSSMLAGPNKKVSEGAIKATVYILMGAGFVHMPQADEFVATDLGRTLYDRVRARRST